MVWGPFVVILWWIDQQCKTSKVPLVLNKLISGYIKSKFLVVFIPLLHLIIFNFLNIFNYQSTVSIPDKTTTDVVLYGCETKTRDLRSRLVNSWSYVNFPWENPRGFACCKPSWASLSGSGFALEANAYKSYVACVLNAGLGQRWDRVSWLGGACFCDRFGVLFSVSSKFSHM